jgi:hypothetical protein
LSIFFFISFSVGIPRPLPSEVSATCPFGWQDAAENSDKVGRNFRRTTIPERLAYLEKVGVVAMGALID